MGRELRSLMGRLAVGVLLVGCSSSCAPPVAAPDVVRAPSVVAPRIDLSAAVGPDGTPIGLPPPSALEHLDDGVRTVAGTGMEAAPGGAFGELSPLEESRSLVLLDGGRSALVGRGYDAIARVSLTDGTQRWRKPVDYFDSARVSPDGTTIAVVESESLALVDASTGISRPLGPSRRVLAFSPDGTRLAAGGPDHGVTLFDVGRARQVGQIGVPGGAPDELAFSPDGRRLAMREGSKVRVWDFARGRTVYLAAIDGATAFAWASDRALLVGDSSGQLSLADIDTAPRPLPAQPLARLVAPVLSLMRPARGALVLADLDTTFASLLELPAGREVARLQKPRGGRFVLAPDGSVAAATGGRLALYDLPSGEPRQSVAGHLGSITAIAERGGRLATGGDDGGVLLWDVETRRPLGRRIGFEPVASLDLAPAEAPSAMAGAVAIGTEAGDILVYDRTLSQRRLTLSLGEPGEYAAVTVAFSPDGRQLAAAGGERSVLIDLERAAVVAAYPSSFSAARFTPELLLVGPSPLRVIRRRDGAELRRADDRGTPDGFALGVLGGRVAVSAVAGEYHNAISALGAPLEQQRGDDAAFALDDLLTFSPDGAVLATVDDPVRFLATADGSELSHRSLPKRPGSDAVPDPSAATFSQDGRTLYVGTHQGVAFVVSAPASPKIARALAPGLPSGKLPMLVDLESTASAVGPRDVAAKLQAEPARTVQLPGRAVSLSADGAKLVLADQDGDLSLYDPVRRTRGESLFGLARVTSGPRGLFLVASRYDDPPTILGGAAPLQVAKGCREPTPIDPDTYLCVGYREVILEGGRTAKLNVKLGSVRATAVDDQSLHIALATAEEIVLLSAQDLSLKGRVVAPYVTDLAFSADGGWLAAASHGVALQVEVSSHRLVRLFEGQRVRSVRLSADGKRLATAGDDRIRIWDTESGQVLALFDPGETVESWTLSPDGRTVLVANGRELAHWQPSVGGSSQLGTDGR